MAIVVSLSGCGVVTDLVAHRADAPSTVTSPRPTSSAAPTPSAGETGLTISQARQALREWVGKYNATLRKREWWRPERQQPIGDWFIAQATYKDTKGHARPHALAFFRSPGQSFRLAVATPIHWGERMPEPRLDADGYITDMDTTVARAVAEEYLNFWNNEKKEGASGYRLAKDSYSRKVFPKVYKGAYVAFAGHGSVFGFRTADGGSFFLFGMVNDPKHVNQVLSEALLVPQGSRTIRELGGNWFS
ncbi:hypothetical protein [Microbispora siamensis]|uniref:hypothetical protein n=1 Tax=Microbispora siamensis TaxID=564413 RepID=UPI001952928F|nr:hypothetical protein [Microbispora siamensis]